MFKRIPPSTGKYPNFGGQSNGAIFWRFGKIDWQDEAPAPVSGKKRGAHLGASHMLSTGDSD